jgi:hypothetical protein
VYFYGEEVEAVAAHNAFTFGQNKKDARARWHISLQRYGFILDLMQRLVGAQQYKFLYCMIKSRRCAHQPPVIQEKRKSCAPKQGDWKKKYLLRSQRAALRICTQTNKTQELLGSRLSEGNAMHIVFLAKHHKHLQKNIYKTFALSKVLG